MKSKWGKKTDKMIRVCRKFLLAELWTVCYFMCKFFSVWKWGGENVADDGGGGGRLQSTEYFHKTGKVQK